MFLDILTSTIDLSEEGDSMNKLITDTINKVVIEIYALQAETEIQRKKRPLLTPFSIQSSPKMTWVSNGCQKWPKIINFPKNVATLCFT